MGLPAQRWRFGPGGRHPSRGNYAGHATGGDAEATSGSATEHSEHCGCAPCLSAGDGYAERSPGGYRRRRGADSAAADCLRTGANDAVCARPGRRPYPYQC